MIDTHWNLTVSVEPTFEPVTLEQARTHVREDGNAQDALIVNLISAARAQQEQTLGLALCTQTLVMKLDGFPCEIRLPRHPVQSVSSITYVDENGDTQTLAAEDYQVDTSSTPARIVPAYMESWPVTRCQPNAVAVTFVAGYTEALAPYPLQQALLMRVADMYELREAQITGAIRTENPVVDALEAPFRLWWF